MSQQKTSSCHWTDTPCARPSTEVYPVAEQVLALRIKVQTAQQFGMITLPAKDRLIITSGVPIKSIVGAMDHKGRNIDVKSLATLEWKVLTSPREQSPCQRGMCYLPSLEVFHAYRTLEEHSDGDTNSHESYLRMNPVNIKHVRAQRAADAKGTHRDMLYCEFKGCSIMVYGKINVCPIGSSRWPGDNGCACSIHLTTDPKGKGKGKGKGKAKGGGKGRRDFTPDPLNPDKPPKGKGRSRSMGKGKSESREDTNQGKTKLAKPDPKGPNRVPEGWKNKDYEDIPIVQNARPADDDVAAYVQGTSEIPTFRVVWMTSLGTTQRTTQVSPNRFGDPNLWKTPDQNAEFWSPCKDGDNYVTLTPDDDDCCRMCPNTDADELIPCAWCTSWAHYRCTYAVGPGRACASHFKVVNPLDKIVVARDDDPVVPLSQQNKQVFPNCCYPECMNMEHPLHQMSNILLRQSGYINTPGEELEPIIEKATINKRRRLAMHLLEFKALRMFPEWERWIAPKPTFLAEQLLKEAATLAEGGEPKNRVKKHNIFEHFKDGFEPHTLPNLPPIFQAFKEYKERSNLNPDTRATYGAAFGTAAT